MNKKKVVIIGGGIAGLVTARELSNNFDVLLLEAAQEFGGRILTLKANDFSVAVEGGAEFVHGEAEETMLLLKDAGLTLSEVKGTFYKKDQSGLVPQEGMIKGWDLILNQLSLVEEDDTLGNFLDSNFNGEQYIELRKQVQGFAEGFDLADIEKVSLKSLYQEWVNNGDDYRINGGYGKLINYLVDDCNLKGCELLKDVRVKDVIWKYQSVQVIAVDQTIYEADYAIITVSIGSLCHPSGLGFSPSIPTYLDQIKSIGFGVVIKIVLEFKDIFWDENAGFIVSEEAIPTWWTQLPAQLPILTGWKGGLEALKLKSHTDEQLLEVALDSIAAIFNKSIDELKSSLVAWKVFNWQNQEYIYGAYSYATLDTAAALDVLNRSIEETLFFAGEGYYRGLHPGTVEAAVVSAQQTTKLLNLLNQKT
jgi:monoamine oxidase